MCFTELWQCCCHNYLLRGVSIIIIETTNLHVLGKCHIIWWLFKVPAFMSPKNEIINIQLKALLLLDQWVIMACWLYYYTLFSNVIMFVELTRSCLITHSQFGPHPQWSKHQTGIIIKGIQIWLFHFLLLGGFFISTVP